jgi:hypothetical protein
VSDYFFVPDQVTTMDFFKEEETSAKVLIGNEEEIVKNLFARR